LLSNTPMLPYSTLINTNITSVTPMPLPEICLKKELI
jgi:hypothetical protein